MAQQDTTGHNTTQQESTGFNSTQYSRGFHRTQQDSAGLGRTPQDSVGLRRTQRDLTGLNSTFAIFNQIQLSSAPSQLSALLGNERDVVEKELTLVVDNLNMEYHNVYASCG